MTFRFEEKYFIERKDIVTLKNYLKKLNLKQLYIPRKISSIYFDNIHNDMFLHSEEGIVPRKKIRIRHYPEYSNFHKWYLEYKINSTEGKFKTKHILNEENFQNYLKKGIFDKIYGNCAPKSIVSYKRDYYFLSNARITIDTEIKYKKFNSSSFFYNEKIAVIEFKSNQLENIKNFYQKIVFNRVRFSKYYNSVINLKL